MPVIAADSLIREAGIRWKTLNPHSKVCIYLARILWLWPN